MSTTGDFDIREVIASSLAEFFERILSMRVELDDGDLLAVLEGEGFVVTVEVTGGLAGRFEIKVGGEFALLMAASMLGGNIEDVDAEFEVPDLLGEMAAFLGRKLKECGSREGLSCEIGEPRIAPRDDMLSVSAPLKRGARCMFRHGKHEGWVDFRLVAGAPGEEPATAGQRAAAGAADATPPAGSTDENEAGQAAPETVAASDGEQSFDLELEPLDEEAAHTGQDFAGLSEEEDLPDLMADITDTGEGDTDPSAAAAERGSAPAQSDGQAVPRGTEQGPAAHTGEQAAAKDARDASAGDFKGLTEKEADVSATTDTPPPEDDAAAPAPETETAASEKTAEPPVPETRAPDREKFVLRHDIDAADETVPGGPDEAPGEEDHRETAGRRRGVFWLAAAVLAAVAAGGWFFMLHQRGAEPVPALKASRSVKVAAPSEPAASPPPETEHAVRRPPEETTPEARLARKLDEAGRLKDALLGKLEEVLRLKRYFQDGIEDVRSQLAVRIQNNGLRSYRQAVKDQRIELDLRTIQRRLAAIDELARPIGWLAHAAEAVDYGIRRTRIDMAMAPYTAGADLQRLYAELDLLTRRFALTDDRLLIDDQTVEARPLAVIWQEVSSPVKKAALVEGSGEKIRGAFVDWAGSAADRRIWKELCRGDFSNAAQLTMISSEAAACLASDQVKDLFLGGLKELSGAAARNLVKWPGRWLVLNGLRSISPAAARQLSRWRGARLSLNGLEELSPQAATALAAWGGRELEMVGLTVKDERQARRILAPLGKWEATGRKLFVSPGLRRVLDALRADGAGRGAKPAGGKKG